MREEEVGDEHGLGATKMRVRGHHRTTRSRGLVGQRAYQRREGLLKARYTASQIEPQIEGHLLVARPSGMKTASGVSDSLHQLSLDEAVHVLVGPGDKGGRRGSSSNSARSKPNEIPKSKAAGSGSVSKRPDQSVSLVIT